MVAPLTNPLPSSLPDVHHPSARAAPLYGTFLPGCGGDADPLPALFPGYGRVETGLPNRAPGPVDGLPSPSGSPRLKRQTSLASSFFNSCCFPCGKHGLCDLDLPASTRKDFLLCRVSKDASLQQQSGTQDSWGLLGSRRKANDANSSWADDAVVGDDLYYKPPRWKLFLRKVRVETRKMNCSKPAPQGFHYDTLSYAMNFDDGCWHQSDPHVQGRFSGPISMEKNAPYKPKTLEGLSL